MQLLEEYLKSYKVPKDVKICDPSFKEFFGEIVDRYLCLCVYSV